MRTFRAILAAGVPPDQASGSRELRPLHWDEDKDRLRVKEEWMDGWMSETSYLIKVESSGMGTRERIEIKC